MSHEATVANVTFIKSKDNSKRFERKFDIAYDADFVQRNIYLPIDKTATPNIIGWSGPARSGTTALLYLLAGHPEIDRLYFQPQQTLMRFGTPAITLNDSDGLVCMKEVFYSKNTQDPHDPIEVLLRSGVPEEKITWIIMLRDPLQTFASWGRHGAKWSPSEFLFWQDHALSLWRKYKDSKVKMIPFVYELLQDQEEETLQKLLAKLGIASISSLEFNMAMINAKLIPGQATDEEYFNLTQKKTIGRGRYTYTTNSFSVDNKTANEVLLLCRPGYEAFLEIAKKELGV